MPHDSAARAARQIVNLLWAGLVRACGQTIWFGAVGRDGSSSAASTNSFATVFLLHRVSRVTALIDCPSQGSSPEYLLTWTSIFRLTCDITYSTMDRKKLDKLWRELGSAWNSPQTAGDLQRIARRAERRERVGGKHQSMWVTDHFAHRPFPIPTHGNKDVSIGVRNVVLNALEADAAAWEDFLGDSEKVENGDGA